jgi:hypothetical protein
MKKIFYIRWVDSSTSEGWQHAPNESTQISVIDTIGYLVYEDKKHIEIAHSHFKDCNTHNGIIAIPKVAIMKRREVMLGKRD